MVHVAVLAARASYAPPGPRRKHLLGHHATALEPVLPVAALCIHSDGVAASIPATLVLFFVDDVLGRSDLQGFFLALYFVCGALGMPLWVRLSALAGKKRAWLLAMVASVLGFFWAFSLGSGDLIAFAAVCALSGLALGADLALPPSIYD